MAKIEFGEAKIRYGMDKMGFVVTGIMFTVVK